jgi:hypothetical protein
MQAMPVAVATHLFCTEGSLVKAALASTSLQQNLLIGASMLTVVAPGRCSRDSHRPGWSSASSASTAERTS